MSDVLLLRHGETAWNRERRVQGWAPTRLTDRGREQADRVGAFLAAAHDVDRIVTSDLARATETTDLVREHVDAPVAADRAWRERDFGTFQGLDYRDLFERFPEFSLRKSGLDAADRRPDGGESLTETRRRVVDAWESLVAAVDPAETVLVVTHGGPLYAVLGHVKGLTLSEAVVQSEQDNCAVNEVHVADGRTELVAENDTDWGQHRA